MLRVLIAAVLLAFSSGAALAQEPFVIVPDNPGGGGASWTATVTANLNMRSGPGTRYRVVHVLLRGETVGVEWCERGWCFVDARVQRGWVSQSYLRRAGGGGGSANREVCFFEEPHMRGRSFCSRPGDNAPDLGVWNNRIASISIRGFPTVQVCVERYFFDCDAFNRDTPVLPWWLDRSISSYRIFH